LPRSENKKVLPESKPRTVSGTRISPAPAFAAIRDARMTLTDSHFKRTRLSVEEPVGRVKRRFAAAAGCSARFSGHFRAGAGGRGQARARPASPADERRWWLPGDALVELEGRGGLEQRMGAASAKDRTA